MLHISDITKFRHCPHLYYLEKNEKADSLSFSFFNFHDSIEQTIRTKLGITSSYNGQVGDNGNKAIEALKDNEWLVNARFTYDELRVRIPFVHNTSEGLDLYFTSLSINPVESLGNNLAISKEILSKNNLVVNKVYIIHLNGEYVRQETLEPEKLWMISENFRTSKGTISRSIQEVIAQQEFNLDELIEEIKNSNDIIPKKNNYCSRCSHFNECFDYYNDLPDNSVLLLSNSKEKERLYNDGILYLQDVPAKTIEGNGIQYSQIMAARSDNGRYVDKAALKRFLKTINSDPAIFIDFEWDIFPIPPYKGLKPMSTIVFQYSLDIIEKEKQRHIDYLGENDCRRELVEHMLENVPEKGNIYAYNADGAEKIRIREYIEEFPEYKEKLESILERMIDLSLPFSHGMIYDLQMRGLYSLKVLTKIIDKGHSYNELDISQGLDAVDAHRKMEQEKDPDKKKKLYQELLEYCAMDTKELVKLYYWLNELAEME